MLSTEFSNIYTHQKRQDIIPVFFVRKLQYQVPDSRSNLIRTSFLFQT